MSSFSFIEQKVQRVLIYSLLPVFLLLTSCISRIHVLQLIRQYWYINKVKPIVYSWVHSLCFVIFITKKYIARVKPRYYQWVSGLWSKATAVKPVMSPKENGSCDRMWGSDWGYRQTGGIGGCGGWLSHWAHYGIHTACCQLLTLYLDVGGPEPMVCRPLDIIQPKIYIISFNSLLYWDTMNILCKFKIYSVMSRY